MCQDRTGLYFNINETLLHSRTCRWSTQNADLAHKYQINLSVFHRIAEFLRWCLWRNVCASSVAMHFNKEWFSLHLIQRLNTTKVWARALGTNAIKRTCGLMSGGCKSSSASSLWWWRQPEFVKHLEVAGRWNDYSAERVRIHATQVASYAMRQHSW